MSAQVTAGLRDQLAAVIRKATLEEVAFTPGATAMDVNRAREHLDRKRELAVTRTPVYTIPASVPVRFDRLPLVKGPIERVVPRADYNAMVARIAETAQYSYNAARTVSRRLAAALHPVDEVPYADYPAGTARLGSGSHFLPAARKQGSTEMERVPSPELLAEHAMRRVTMGWGTYDLHIMQGVKATGDQKITFSFGDTPAAAAGIQKLCAQVAMRLLTRIGSDTLYPEYGSQLPTQLVGKDVVSSRLRIISALDYVRGWWQRKEALDLPAEERLVDLKLLSLRIEGTALVLRIHVVSAAGSSRPVVLPLVETEVRYGY